MTPELKQVEGLAAAALAGLAPAGTVLLKERLMYHVLYLLWLEAVIIKLDLLACRSHDMTGDMA
jgi:hypothetical protein